MERDGPFTSRPFVVLMRWISHPCSDHCEKISQVLADSSLCAVYTQHYARPNQNSSVNDSTGNNKLHCNSRSGDKLKALKLFPPKDASAILVFNGNRVAVAANVLSRDYGTSAKCFIISPLACVALTVDHSGVTGA